MDKFNKQFEATKKARKDKSFAAFRFGKESDEFHKASEAHAKALDLLKKIVIEDGFFFPADSWAAVL